VVLLRELLDAAKDLVSIVVLKLRLVEVSISFSSMIVNEKGVNEVDYEANM
jgi:hypothetical protein